MGYCHKHDEPFTIQCKGCKLDKLQTRLEQAERERDEWKELSISCQVATIKLADKYVKEIQAEITALRTRLEEAEKRLAVACHVKADDKVGFDLEILDKLEQAEREGMKYYKVLGKGGVACNGGKGKWYLPKNDKPSKWMPKIEDIKPCENGYHLCELDDLLDWLNEEIYEAEGRGKSIRDDNKTVFQEARLIRKCDGWNEKTARLFAADCAERVLPIYEKKYPDDDRPRKAIKAARKYANGKITKEQMAAADAAGAAAGAAARAAAWDAAGAAAGDAAGAAMDAERKWQIERLQKILDGGKG